MQQQVKNIFPKFMKPVIYLVLVLIAIIIAIPFVIWIAMRAYDLVFNGDLRAKESYKREITVNFEYQGKDYVMKPVVTCVNKGTTINEGSLEWYTKWNMNLDGSTLVLDDGTEVRFWFNRFYDGLIEKAFETKIEGHANSECDIILSNEKSVENIESMMRFYNKEQYLSVTLYNTDMKQRLSSIKEEYYPNSGSNLMSIRDTKHNRHLDIKIKSYQVGEKVIIDKKSLKELSE